MNLFVYYVSNCHSPGLIYCLYNIIVLVVIVVVMLLVVAFVVFLVVVLVVVLVVTIVMVLVVTIVMVFAVNAKWNQKYIWTLRYLLIFYFGDDNNKKCLF